MCGPRARGSSAASVLRWNATRRRRGISPPDWRLFEEAIWPALVARIPAFAALRAENAWAGHYAYNTVDPNALSGLHPGCANLYFVNGFSGHGLQQWTGRGLVTGDWRILDLSALEVGRLAAGRKTAESNVI